MAEKETVLPEPNYVAMRKIDAEGSPRARVRDCEETVNEYFECRVNGDKFPPIDLFWIEEHNVFWIADGKHRFAAEVKKGETMVWAVVHEGGARECLEFALRANARHGQRRTNADKRLAVKTMLEDEEWSQCSNGKIAEALKVSETLVFNVRKELEPDVSEEVEESSGKEVVEDRVSQKDPAGDGESPRAKAQPKKRIGKDGKEYTKPAKKEPRSKPESTKPGGKEAIPPELRKEAKTVWGSFIRLTDKVPEWKELISPEVKSISEKMKSQWARGGK